MYKIEGIKDVREVKIKTPFGNPSDKIVTGSMEGFPGGIAFLPRHGVGHRIMPSELNSRANIYALKSLGVTRILSISACGSLKEEIKPCDFVFPDQLFDRTKCRNNSFFGKGIVGHIGFAEPFCRTLSGIVYAEACKLGIRSHPGGTYVCIDGPQFSTKAESEVNRKSGFSIVGMTAIPEAKLAREAEICYATIGLVTDYDVWKEGEEVSIGQIIQNLNRNVDNVKNLIKKALPLIAQEKECGCNSALKHAIFTNRKYMNKAALAKLKPLIGKYI